MKKFLFFLLFSAIAGLILFQAFSPGLVRPQKERSLVIRNHIIFDQQFLDLEFFRMLIPKAWKFEGGLVWNFSSGSPSCTFSHTVSSPDGNSVIEQFPTVGLYWPTDQMMNNCFARPGFLLIQPVSVVDFLQQLFIPRARQGTGNLRVVETQPVPELARHYLAWNNLLLNLTFQIIPSAGPYETRGDAARIKVEYVADGLKITEDFLVSFNFIIQNAPTAYGMYAQQVTREARVISFRCPTEEMSRQIRLFQITCYSRF